MEHKDYIDYLSVISAFAVVMLHLNSCFWDFSYERYWITANFIECVMYFVVPVFLMISGATLMDYSKKYSTVLFFKKRILKTLIPFLFWSMIGLLFLTLFNEKNIFEMSFLEVANAVMNTEIIQNFWFFIPLFACYLCIPVLGSIPDNLKNKAYLYIVLMSIILNSFLPLIGEFIGFSFRLSYPIGSDFIIFLLIGFLIDRNEIGRKTRMIIYLFGIMGFLFHFFGTWYLSYENGEVIQTFKGYTNLPSILYATSAFVFIKYACRVGGINKILHKITAPFVKLTFGIYLIHWFVMYILLYINILPETSILYRVGGGIFVFCISALLVYIFRKLPILRKTVP